MPVIRRVGGYEFLTLFPYEPQFVVTFKYFRDRGFHEVGYIVANDAGGQDAEKALLYAANLPENKSVQIVAHEYFTPGDFSAAAQLIRIKEAKPDALVIWATGTAAGTIFRSAQELALDLPTVTSPGNLNVTFFRQYSSTLPANVFFATVPLLCRRSGERCADTSCGCGADQRARAAGCETGYDRDLGLGSGHDRRRRATQNRNRCDASKLRAYISTLHNWTGVNGPYDFHAEPQRGLGNKNIVMVRYETKTNLFLPASKLGGAALPGQ